MKKIIILGAFLIGGFMFSQVKIPQKSSSGNITTSTNLQIKYTNLSYEKGKVTFTNAETGNEEFLYDNSIKSLEYNSEPINGKITEYNQPEIENESVEYKPAKSVYQASEIPLKSDSYITNTDYIKAKKLNQLGTGFLVGGGACFLVGGLLNLSKSNETTVNSQNQNAESKGSSVPLIIGLAGMGAGLVMKISGNSGMKKIKNSSVSTIKSEKEYFVVTNQNGFGVKMNF
jgi:hypothetical protein